MIKTKLPTALGPIHFIGIGGIGMSGIAEMLMSQGYHVKGSDVKPSDNTRRLEKLGAEIFIGQEASNIEGADVIVISSAIKAGNTELDAARAKGLPIVRRAEMLAELMRLRSNIAVAGTHGKTTTTTMVAALLDEGGVDPTVINGGIIHSYGSNARMGAGDWMVVEADESDGSFNKLPATLAIITNIDAEHMEHYQTLDALRDAFYQFASNIPFYGVAICNSDHSEVKQLIGRLNDRRVISYGFNAQAEVRALNLEFENGHAYFDVHFQATGEKMEKIMLPMPGRHNVSNALAAIAVAHYLEVHLDDIKSAFAQFKGVNRRFTHVGNFEGIKVIDDYAHHPVEIEAVLSAARLATKGRVIAVHQPHRFSRLHDLFEDFCGAFNDADIVGIADVFAAGETAIKGADREGLVAGLTAHGHRGAHSLKGETELKNFVKTHATSDDLLICLGAGTISAWAHRLVGN